MQSICEKRTDFKDSKSARLGLLAYFFLIVGCFTGTIVVLRLPETLLVPFLVGVPAFSYLTWIPMLFGFRLRLLIASFSASACLLHLELILN